MIILLNQDRLDRLSSLASCQLISLNQLGDCNWIRGPIHLSFCPPRPPPPPLRFISVLDTSVHRKCQACEEKLVLKCISTSNYTSNRDEDTYMTALTSFKGLGCIFLKLRKKAFCHPVGGWGEKSVGGGWREQKRYNFTAEHARLVLRCERGRISHLR